MTSCHGRALAAEALGSMLLLATVVGSGIMASSLADGNIALALLANTVATGAILVVLILTFAPLSGAHFNPAVTLAFFLRRELTLVFSLTYMLAQCGGAILGIWLAHVMFDVEVLQISQTTRTGLSQWVAELVATSGLVVTILLCLGRGETIVAPAVGLYITAAYWFTSSTSFANPAVTLARMLTDSFSGIRPEDAAAFVLAQLAGAVIAVTLARCLGFSVKGQCKCS